MVGIGCIKLVDKCLHTNIRSNIERYKPQIVVSSSNLVVVVIVVVSSENSEFREIVLMHREIILLT